MYPKEADLSDTVLVKNLLPDVTENELIELFSTFGSVLSISIARHFETGCSLGFACVVFENCATAMKVMSFIDNWSFCGKPSLCGKPGSIMFQSFALGVRGKNRQAFDDEMKSNPADEFLETSEEDILRNADPQNEGMDLKRESKEFVGFPRSGVDSEEELQITEQQNVAIVPSEEIHKKEENDDEDQNQVDVEEGRKIENEVLMELKIPEPQKVAIIPSEETLKKEEDDEEDQNQVDVEVGKKIENEDQKQRRMGKEEENQRSHENAQPKEINVEKEKENEDQEQESVEKKEEYEKEDKQVDLNEVDVGEGRKIVKEDQEQEGIGKGEEKQETEVEKAEQIEPKNEEGEKNEKRIQRGFRKDNDEVERNGEKEKQIEEEHEIEKQQKKEDKVAKASLDEKEQSIVSKKEIQKRKDGEAAAKQGVEKKDEKIEETSTETPRQGEEQKEERAGFSGKKEDKVQKGKEETQKGARNVEEDEEAGKYDKQNENENEDEEDDDLDYYPHNDKKEGEERKFNDFSRSTEAKETINLVLSTELNFHIKGTSKDSKIGNNIEEPDVENDEEKGRVESVIQGQSLENTCQSNVILENVSVEGGNTIASHVAGDSLKTGLQMKIEHQEMGEYSFDEMNAEGKQIYKGHGEEYNDSGVQGLDGRPTQSLLQRLGRIELQQVYLNKQYLRLTHSAAVQQNDESRKLGEFYDSGIKINQNEETFWDDSMQLNVKARHLYASDPRDEAAYFNQRNASQEGREVDINNNYNGVADEMPGSRMPYSKPCLSASKSGFKSRSYQVYPRNSTPLKSVRSQRIPPRKVDSTKDPYFDMIGPIFTQKPKLRMGRNRECGTGFLSRDVSNVDLCFPRFNAWKSEENYIEDSLSDVCSSFDSLSIDESEGF